MSPRFKDAATLILLVSGVALLGITYLGQSAEPPAVPLPEPESPRPMFLDVEALLSEESFVFNKSVQSLSDADILAVFVLHADVCPPCINEVVEYAELLRERQDSLRIELVALVLNADSVKAARFVKIVDLPMPVGRGYPATLVEPLTNYNDVSRTQQLVFVRKDTAFFRILLLGSSNTSLEGKQQMLARMVVQANRHGDLSFLQPPQPRGTTP